MGGTNFVGMNGSPRTRGSDLLAHNHIGDYSSMRTGHNHGFSGGQNNNNNNNRNGNPESLLRDFSTLAWDEDDRIRLQNLLNSTMKKTNNERERERRDVRSNRSKIGFANKKKNY